jgi:purine-cytosine permease-like protein
MGGAVVCMDQVWFVGPVAKKIGDIGFLVGFGLAMLSYCALRRGERKIFGR